MKKEFIPYEEALALKELGFDEQILIEYDNIDIGTYYKKGRFSYVIFDYQGKITYQQAFRWFREKHKMNWDIVHYPEGKYFEYEYSIRLKEDWESKDEFKTYEEAELECLRKLIEIVKNEK